MIKDLITVTLKWKEAFKLKRKILTILVLIATILTVDYVFIHLIFPIKKQKMIQEMNFEVQKSLEQNPPEQQGINDL